MSLNLKSSTEIARTAFSMLWGLEHRRHSNTMSHNEAENENVQQLYELVRQSVQLHELINITNRASVSSYALHKLRLSQVNSESGRRLILDHDSGRSIRIHNGCPSLHRPILADCLCHRFHAWRTSTVHNFGGWSRRIVGFNALDGIAVTAAVRDSLEDGHFALS